MRRLAPVRHLARAIGSVRRAGRPSVLRTFRRAEGKQRKLSYKQNISPNHEPSFDPTGYLHVDFRNGTRNSLKCPLTPQTLGTDLPTKAVQRELQDGSLQTLSPEMEEIFKSRLSKILEGLETFRKTAEWKDIIRSRTKDEWLSRITTHTPADVKLMLASQHPPTPAQLKSLPWSNTADGGVFAWCTERNRRRNSSERTLYVYIGSASKFHGGLNFRKNHMLSRLDIPHDEGLKAKIKDLGLNPEGEFKRLFTVPFENGSDVDVMDKRALVVLARSVLMIWLGAVNGRLKAMSQGLVPWGLEKIEYIGLAEDMPLTTGLNKCGRTRGQNKRRQVVFTRKLSAV